MDELARTLVICSKYISEKWFLFNANVKIIKASLNVLIKVLIQKARFYRNLYINHIS